MVREIEKTGMPVVHLTNMVPVAQSVGSNRIVKAIAIPHPMCDTSLPEEAQYKQRYQLVRKALEALSTDIKEQTVFTAF